MAPSLTSGARATAIIRPERIQVERRQAPSGQTATIRDVVYLGARQKLKLAFSDGTSLAATIPSRQEYAVGETVSCSWAPEDVYFLPDED